VFCAYTHADGHSVDAGVVQEINVAWDSSLAACPVGGQGYPTTMAIINTVQDHIVRNIDSAKFIEEQYGNLH
jgi:hypothetical protein